MAANAVIRDLDGVIADTAPYHFSAWQQVARERGTAFTKADFRQTFGKRNPEIIAEKFGISQLRKWTTFPRRKKAFSAGLRGRASSRFQGY